MPSMDYEILSKLMRGVFLLLGLMIVWRTYAWLSKDRRQTHKRLSELPDAGTIGILTVLQGSSELPEGSVIPVPQEGVLGFVRTCDIVVPVDDVIAQHLDFTFRNGKGLYIYPRRGCPAAVDGVTLDSHADSRRYPMQHGSVLSVGEAVLQLGVFAGLDVRQYCTAPAGPEPFPPEQPYPPLPPCEEQPEAAPSYAPPLPPYQVHPIYPPQPFFPPQVNYPPSIPTEGRLDDET